MDSTDSYSPSRLFLRSFMPSLASGTLGLLISIIFLGLHILFFSLSLGSFIPALASDQWIQTYTDFIIRPVEAFFHNSLLNTLLTALVWGFVGLIIYTALEAIFNVYHTWQNDEQQVRVVDSQRIELHPLRRYLITRALWRALISISVVLLIILTGSLSHYLLVHLDHALSGTSVFNIVWRTALTVGVWTLLIHCFVILLRLFMFRTRVLGEVIH